jgi:class 3 adenylate cyclase/prephenate dehydratase
MKTPPDSASADAQGIIADLRRQLAERTAERDEAVAQQTATTDVLQVINSSSGNLAPVFDAMLEKAHSLCDSGHWTLFLRDGDYFRPAAMQGVPEPIAARLRGGILATGNPVIGPLLVGERFVHIEDTALSDYPMIRLASENGVRTLLSVPLKKGNEVLGMIVAARFETPPFSEKQIELIENFAAQAVVAMENARLITETREALEQQTATAEVLGVINSSPGDLAPVFDAMLEKAMRLCDASFGGLTRVDGDKFHQIASHNVPTALFESMRQARPIVPGNAHYRLLKGEDVVQVEDVTDEDIYRSGNPARRALADLGGARTVLWAALRKDNVLFGSFVLYRNEVRPFSDNQIALLQNFAAQAVIAMENARLITETREALDQQTATAEVLGVINASPGDLVPVFDAILEKAHSLCGAAQGAMFLYDGDAFRAVATRAMPEAFTNRLRQGVRTGPVAAPLIAGEPLVHVIDLAAVVDDPTAKGAVEIAGTRTLLAVPLRKGDALLGMIASARREVRPFSEREIALLQNFAAQAVIAMENARLLGELRQRTEEVAELNRGLEARVAEQVEELGRVGRLKRFLAPQLAELIVSQGDEKILESHRREIVVVFCDLRGYTAFTETAEPEEVLDFLREYHGALGPLVAQFEGTLDQFSGDGIMVFFNDPVPVPDPAERAVAMAVAMREAASALIADWRERGRDLGFGVGIAQGYATLGQIGFAERSGYTAIGTVCNVAARLCAEAKDRQILLSQRVNVALKGSVVTEQVGALALKGLTQPVVAYNVPLAATQPALRVIEGGPQSV